MKFTVLSTYIKKQLSLVIGPISNNPIMPVLENFLFEIKDGVLKTTATDTNTTMIVDSNVDTTEEGSIAVPAKIFLETLSNLPDQIITFSFDEISYNIEITTNDGGTYKLLGTNPQDYPKTIETTDTSTVMIYSTVLSKGIKTTKPMIGTDEMRPAMTGVLFKFQTNALTLVSTDGHRLIRYTRTDVTCESEGECIVQKKALDILKLPIEKTDVIIGFNDSCIIFKFQNIQMISRVINDKFPNYENVIPHNNDNIFTVNKTNFLGTLKRTFIYADTNTHLIRLNLTDNHMEISAENIDRSTEAKENLIVEHSGEDIEIGFNGKSLINIFEILDTDMVDFKMLNPSKAALILPLEQELNEDILILVMPVILNSNND
ncbi:MAG: DNA polymerase III subunit beta [Chitinophagaceae bacterium]|nr:DNA polymerase III subunit beta [Chitinophagaceae bacterium]